MSKHATTVGPSTRWHLGALLLALMLFLSACGGAAEAPAEEAAAGEEPAGEAAGEAGGGEVVIASWGGDLQEAQREAYWKPFQEETGITVLEGESPDQARTKAQVDSGRPEWDIISSAVSIFNEFGPDYFEPIDYDSYPEAYADIPEDRKREYAVANTTWCEAIVYRTDVYPDGGPQSYEDFWDVERFPGKRGLPLDGGVPWNTVEAAYLSSGAADRDDLYGTLDVDVAFDQLTKLAPHIGKFWSSGAEASQLLASGEVDMIVMSTGGALDMIDDGLPVAMTWQDALCGADYWYILKGSQNLENAQRLIASMQDAERQGQFASMYANGVPHPKANDYIDAERAKNLPTHPDNVDRIILQEFPRAEFWGANREQIVERFTEWRLESGA